LKAKKIVVYTRRGCHLCEEVHAQLTRYGLTPELVDIDLDPELKSRYDDCVPVVWFDGKERFRGPISDVLLSRLLAAE
jgi:glutaredoxin